jgi:transposase InsO family protein
MSSQEFIGAIKEEYLRRKSRTGTTTDQAYYAKTVNKNRPLADRIHNPNKPTEVVQSSSGCKNCGYKGHTTDNCRWLGQQKCDKCGWFGTEDHDCQKRIQKRKADKEKWRVAKKVRKEQVNQVMEDEAIVFTAEEQAGACNFDTYNSLDIEGNDERLLFYDWLADSATTSHVTNMREAFTSFQSLVKPVSGVGNAKAQAEGKGTVKIQTKVNGKQFLLVLEDVLYIPSNPQNLISLGRWDKAGGYYQGGDGKLIMNLKDGQTIATGTRINNHLYKLNQITIPQYKSTNRDEQQTFVAANAAQDWEVWHRRFGHIGKDSLQTLHDKCLVDGLLVNTESPHYDCQACTQAKQHVEPFPRTVEQKIRTQPGDLTHMDLCGKCTPNSIHGNQYFHTFLDDATRRPHVCFLKTKDGASLAIKNYVTNLKTQGKNPKALRFDRGGEFINDDLTTWLNEQGIERQMTAGYSPSQNGAAERLNRTLIELARAMLLARQVPLFLWEYAIRHAAYLRERTEMRAKPGTTPYTEWYGIKPNVAHL